MHLTIADLCKKWRVSRWTIWRWAAAGLIKPSKMGNRLRFTPEEIRRCERLQEQGRFA